MVLFGGIISGVSASDGSTEVRIVEWDLSETRGDLEVLDDQRASVRGVDGGSSNLAPKNIAFIEFIHDQASKRPTVRNPGMLVLNDGTRYTGWPESSGERFVWLNWWCGTIRPETDEIVSISRFDSGEPNEAFDEDVVRLRNKDLITGLVLDVGSSVEIENQDSETIRIPMDRIDSLSLVNPPKDASLSTMWLLQGDKVPIEGHEFGIGTGLRMPGREPLQPSNILSIALDPGRLVPLSECPSSVEMLEDMIRYRIPEPSVSSGTWSLDAAPIELKGPLRARWTLPESGMGFIGTLTIPRTDRRVGSFGITIKDGRKVVLKMTLDGDNPTADVSIQMESNELTIEIDEGEMGPIQDVLRLDRALLIRTSS